MERMIRSLSDVHDALEHYVNAIPYEQLLSTATHISTDIDFRDVSAAEMESALKHRDEAGAEERDIYASYINELFLTKLEKHGNEIVF